jgi:hypothetical protein
MNTPPERHAIVLIRHAEKPVREGEQGVDHLGRPDPHSLSVRGWQRAGALVRWLDPCGGAAAALPRPGTLFAARPLAAHPSLRPRQTVEPLAEALGLALRLDFSSDAVADAAQAMRAAARHAPVLACWRHDDLPALARALLPSDAALQPIPAHWPDVCFDRAWLLEPAGADGWTWRALAQQLLPGDASAA